MADEEKLAAALEQIVSNYEGDPDDPVWKQAKEALASMKPKSMFLLCPKCGLLHVDKDEWVKKPHQTHLCVKCEHRWKPHAYPTVGVSIPGMEAVESTAFLTFWSRWLAFAKKHNPQITAKQAREIQKFMADGWKAGRDFWLSQQEMTKASKPKRKSKSKKKEEEVELDPAIKEMISKGQVTWDDVDGLGHNPADYGMKKPTHEVTPEQQEEAEDIADELGIEFGVDPDAIDEDTGIQL